MIQILSRDILLPPTEAQKALEDKIFEEDCKAKGTFRTWYEPTSKTGYLSSYSFEDNLASALRGNLREYTQINQVVLKTYDTDQILALYFCPPFNPTNNEALRQGTQDYLHAVYAFPYRPARTLFHLRREYDLKKRTPEANFDLIDMMTVMRILGGEMTRSAVIESFLARRRWFYLMDQIQLKPPTGKKFKDMRETAISMGMKG